MRKDIAVAVVGTGFIGPVHVEALRRLGIRVKGILGSNVGKSAKASLALNLETAYKNFEEILEDREITSVHITSPNRYHTAQVEGALNAGKHVVCEKPLAMTSTETAALVASAKKHPELITAVNYNVRFYPQCLQARALIRKGEIGQVLHIQGSYTQDWLLYSTDFNWRVMAEEGGDTRAIGDIGTHWLDLISFISGLEIDAVMADLATVHPVRHRPASGSIETFVAERPSELVPVKIETEDYGSVLLRFKNGQKGVLTVSQVTAGRKNCIRFEIAGAQKSLAWNSERAEELWIGKRKKVSQLFLRDPALLEPEVREFTNYPGGHAEGFPDSFKQQYRAIYADIAAGKKSEHPLYATFEDGHKELLLCEAILKSHRAEGWVKV
jgi:predicted dehydrogenase